MPTTPTHTNFPGQCAAGYWGRRIISNKNILFTVSSTHLMYVMCLNSPPEFLKYRCQPSILQIGCTRCATFILVEGILYGCGDNEDSRLVPGRQRNVMDLTRIDTEYMYFLVIINRWLLLWYWQILSLSNTCDGILWNAKAEKIQDIENRTKRTVLNQDNNIFNPRLLYVTSRNSIHVQDVVNTCVNMEICTQE